ncbi:MAG: mechanosensitive ion channel family protein [Fibromonadaceae bacterium]|jgi:small-conductance mechanosensitive channel|nr:mechanosensitive ion channel family protein [Fibromonadaceae bacterium]
MLRSIYEYLSGFDWVEISRLALLSVAVVAGQIAIYVFVRKLFKKKINPFIASRSSEDFKGIKFRNYMLLTPARLLHISFFFSKLLMYAVLIFSFYISITLLFGIYPGTRSFAYTLFHGVLDPFLAIIKSFIDYIPSLLQIIVIIAVTHYFVKFLKFLSKEISAERIVIQGFYPDWAHATFNLLRFLSYAFMVILIFPLLPDSETAVFRGVSVFLGVLFSLGSTTVISNVVAGMVLTYMRSFKLGDRVKVGEVLGDVVEKTPFAVRIKTSKKEVVTVPNGTLLSSNVVNFSTSGDERSGVILYMPVTVSYDVPLRNAIELITQAALKTENVLTNPPPFVLVKNLGNAATELELNVYTNEPERQPRIFSDMNANIRSLFEQNGINMVTPVFSRVFLENPDNQQ